MQDAGTRQPDAAKRLFEQSATEWERSRLPKYDDEGWIELYHHLLKLRSKLTFDRLVGKFIGFGADRTSFHSIPGFPRSSTALCSNHVMRSGRHFAFFTYAVFGRIGVVRPVQINEADFGDGDLDYFSPGSRRYWEYLIGQRTDRWTDSNVG